MKARDAARVRATLSANAASLLGYFERRTESADDAADLVAETMLQTWRRAAAVPVDDCTAQRMWLFGVATNVLANHRRASRRRSALAARLRNVAAEPASREDPAEGVAVRDAVSRLPGAQRELVMLVHWDGFTLAESAEILRINPSTARSRYAGARAMLRQAMEPEPSLPASDCR